MMRAAELMSTPVVTVRPETPVKEVAAQMAAHGVSGVPVVDRFGGLVGIVSESDFLMKMEYDRRGTGLSGLLDRIAALFNTNRRADARTASDLMTRRVVTASPAASVRELVHLMAAHDINRIPIVDAGRLVGIVTRADILRTMTRRDDAITEEIRWRLVHDLWIDTDDLVISTRNGVVSIAGMVERRSEAALVERWAAATDGVVAVDTQALRFRFDDERIKVRTDRLR